MTPAEERQIAMKYMGLLAWPTILLFAVLVAAYTYVIVAVVNGSLPLLAGTAINLSLIHI